MLSAVILFVHQAIILHYLKPIYTPECNTVTPAQMSQDGDYETGYYSDPFTVKCDANKPKFLVVPLILALNVTIFRCFY